MSKLTAWIVYNGNMLQEKFLYHVKWLKKEAENQGVEAILIRNTELLAGFSQGRTVLMGKYSDKRPDFVLFWDKDVNLASHLESLGFKVFNSSRSIALCDDKILTYKTLADKNIPMAKTIIAPFVYGNMKIENLEFFDYAEEELGYPLIIKEAYGSFGAQVYMVKDKEELLKKVLEIGPKPCLLQEYIKSSHGRDIRINVVGNEVVASMFRQSKGDFRANISAGGTMEAYEPNEEEKSLAIKCSKIIGADFAGIDLLFGKKGERIVCEVNSNAHMKNIYDCTGINVAEKIISYVIERIGKEHEA